MISEFQWSLNRLAGTLDSSAQATLDAQGAANRWAGTVGLDLLGALNRKAGTTGLGINEVCNRLAGTTKLDAQAALDSFADTQYADGFGLGGFGIKPWGA